MYLSKVLDFPKDKKVYVIGQEGLEEELDTVGVQHVGGSVSDPTAIVLEHIRQLTLQDPEDRVFTELDFPNWKADPTVGAVLCGFDAFVSESKGSAADPAHIPAS